MQTKNHATCPPDGSLTLQMPEDSLTFSPLLIPGNQQIAVPSFEILADISESLGLILF